MPQYLSPGVYVEEVSSTLKPIQGVGTSTGAFVGFAEKGPIGEPILIGNRAEFFNKFGGYISNAELAYAVNLFFQNGGTRCYVVRTSAHDSASGDALAQAATATIEDGLGNDALLIEAASPGATGDSIPSPGAWGNSLSISIEHAWNPQVAMDLSASPAPLSGNFNDVSFVNATTGWAVGEAGVIAATSDGGNHWRQQVITPLGTTAISTALNAVQFVDAQSGWAVGEGGVIAATIPWTIQNSGVAGALNAIQFVDDQNGWAVGDGATIVNTDNGGDTWGAQSLPAGATGPVTQNISTLQLLDEYTGWLIGAGGLIAARDGANWSLENDPTAPSPAAGTENLNDLSMLDADTGWAVGDNGTIAFRNAGAWTSQAIVDPVTLAPVTVTDDLHAAQFLSAASGWAVGENDRIVYFNGVNWITQNSASGPLIIGNDLNALHVENDSAVWAVGDGGTIVYWDGSRWVSQTDATVTTENLSAVTFVNATRGWAVGANGTIVATTDGGRSWQRQGAGATTEDLHSVHFINAATGWAYGDAGTVLTTTDGGSTWTRQPTGVTANLTAAQIRNSSSGAIAGAGGTILRLGQSWIQQTNPSAEDLSALGFVDDASRGWAVGANGAIVSTTDHGANWTSQNDSTGITAEDLNAVEFRDVNTCWVVGANGAIAGTTDGGANWILQNDSTGITSEGLNAVQFFDATTGWAVGTNGTIVATTNGGTTWTAQVSTTTEDLNQVEFVTADIGWGVGANGTIVTTADGGATWTAQNSNTTEDLTQIRFINETTGWAGGDGGVILATTDRGITWVPQSSGTRQAINALQIVNYTEGYAVGDGGSIVSMQDGIVTEPNGFRLIVFDKGEEVERYDAVTLGPGLDSYIEVAVNNISNNIRVTTNPPPTAAPTDRPRVVERSPLTGGDDGINDPDIRNIDFTGSHGLQAFNEVDDINIVVIPDSASRDVMLQGINYCENRKDCFFVAHATEAEDTAQEALAFKQATGPEFSGQNAFNSSFGALYVPWIEVPDPLTNKTKLVAPSAAVAGRYSATDVRRGVHKAPAGREDGLLRGVLGLDRQFSQAEIETLNPQNVNTLKTISGVGPVIWGARTVSADASLRYVSTRRLLLYIEESIDEGTQWVVFEPNTPALWRSIERNIRAFLRVVWRSGALFGDVEDNAFSVKCDAETNPPDSIEAGMVVTEIGVAIVKPAEFVIFRISQAKAGSVISE